MNEDEAGATKRREEIRGQIGSPNGQHKKQKLLHARNAEIGSAR